MMIHKKLLVRGRRVTEVATQLPLRFMQYLVQLAGPRPTSTDWLACVARVSAKSARAAVRSYQDNFYLLQDLYRVLAPADLNRYLSNAYMYRAGDVMSISIYPTGDPEMPEPSSLMIQLIGALNLALTKWDTEPYSAYSNKVDITVSGHCPAFGEVQVVLRAVDGGPSCRVVERTRIIPAAEETYLTVECTDREVPYE